MMALGNSYEDKNRLDLDAYDLYARFRPDVMEGKSGWGQKTQLNLDRIRSMASRT